MTSRERKVAFVCAVLAVAAISTEAFQTRPPSENIVVRHSPTSTSTSTTPGNCCTSIRAFDWSRSYASKSHDSTEQAPTLSIHSLLEDGRIDDAVNELKTSSSEEVPASTYHAVIEACCAGGFESNPKKRQQQQKNKHSKQQKDRIESAAELLQSMGPDKVTAHAHEILISGYSRRGRWQGATRTLSSMEEIFGDATPSLNSYQTVLVSLAKANQFNQMFAILTRMRKNGARLPNVYTYNSLLKICASDKIPRWKEGLSILSQCQREPGVTPDLITYTTAMRACARGRQAGKAMELFRVVKDMNMDLDVYVYTTAMDACAKGKRWKQALKLLDEMKDERGIVPNEVTYGVAVNACGNGGQWERALELLDQMKAMNLKVNTITYNSAITALSKAARAENKQRASAAGSGEPVVDTNVLWKKALDIVECMKREGVRRDAFTFSSAITVCGAAGRWQEAVDLIHAMKVDRTKPNKVAYTAAISACANSRYVL